MGPEESVGGEEPVTSFTDESVSVVVVDVEFSHYKNTFIFNLIITQLNYHNTGKYDLIANSTVSASARYRSFHWEQLN